MRSRKTLGSTKHTLDQKHSEIQLNYLNTLQRIIQILSHHFQHKYVHACTYARTHTHTQTSHSHVHTCTCKALGEYRGEKSGLKKALLNYLNKLQHIIQRLHSSFPTQICARIHIRAHTHTHTNKRTSRSRVHTSTCKALGVQRRKEWS